MDDFEDENDEDTEKSEEPTEKDATTEEDDSDLESTPETENAAKASPEALFLPVKDAKPSTKEQRAEEDEELTREDTQKNLPWMDMMVELKRFLPL